MSLNDFFGKPAVLMRVKVPREITAQGAASAHVAAACSLVGGMLMILAMGVLLRGRVVQPLETLAAHAKRVGQEDDLTGLLRLDRKDEIGALAEEFDRMVEKLAASRKKLAETAHRAGMADVASEVLHNVGNVVNSANASLESLEARIASSKVTGLDKAVALLREQAPRAAEFFGEDPRGAKLIAYLGGVSEALRSELEGYQKEVARLREAIRHIRGAIATQQAHATIKSFRLEVEMREWVEEVVRLHREDLTRNGIELAVELPSQPAWLHLNRAKMSQVLVNLVRNAIDSLKASETPAKELRITGRADAGGWIELEVADNGVGFSPETGAKLFSQGFSTKAAGNGIGLHFCANAVQAEGGEIGAKSEGPGKGAAFSIRLPMAGSKRVPGATRGMTENQNLRRAA